MAEEGCESMNLRLLVNKETQQILYGEAGKDFVDLLLSFLGLPIGYVLKLFSASKRHKIVGSVTNLYDSLDKLPSQLLNADKSELLNPEILSTHNPTTLRIDQGENIGRHSQNYYVCGYNNNNNCYGPRTHSLSKQAGERCDCGNAMNCAVQFRQNAKAAQGESSGYVKETVTFIITDDLIVKPTSTIETIMLLNRLNIKDLSKLDDRNATVGPNEVLDLLWASLVSATPLNDVFGAKISSPAKVSEEAVVFE